MTLKKLKLNILVRSGLCSCRVEHISLKQKIKLPQNTFLPQIQVEFLFFTNKDQVNLKNRIQPGDP